MGIFAHYACGLANISMYFSHAFCFVYVVLPFCREKADFKGTALKTHSTRYFFYPFGRISETLYLWKVLIFLF